MDSTTETVTAKPRLIELPVQLYRLFTTEPTAPRIYAIGARGYLVDYDEFKAWKPPEKAKKK
jgi:hypothetical protein